MVTNYPQQLTATADSRHQTARHGDRSPRRWPSRSDVLRAARPRRGAALRGQARDDALHVVRARHAGLGGQRTRPAPALRRRRAAASAHDRSGSYCARAPEPTLIGIRMARSRSCPAILPDIFSEAGLTRPRLRPIHDQFSASAASASRHADVIDPDVFLDAVKAGAAGTEQHRRNAGAAEHRGVGPETHADESAPPRLPRRAARQSARGKLDASRRHLVRRPRRTSTLHRRLELGVLVAQRARAGRASPRRQASTGFARHRPPLHLQPARNRDSCSTRGRLR